MNFRLGPRKRISSLSLARNPVCCRSSRLWKPSPGPCLSLGFGSALPVAPLLFILSRVGKNCFYSGFCLSLVHHSAAEIAPADAPLLVELPSGYLNPRSPPQPVPTGLVLPGGTRHGAWCRAAGARLAGALARPWRKRRVRKVCGWLQSFPLWGDVFRAAWAFFSGWWVRPLPVPQPPRQTLG